MSQSYIPPHKRKEAAVSLKPADFPSLSANDIPKAGAGGPSYVSKINIPIVQQPVKTADVIKPTVLPIPFVEKAAFVEPFTKTVVDEGEWITKESKSSKKTKPDSDWDGFDDY